MKIKHLLIVAAAMLLASCTSNDFTFAQLSDMQIGFDEANTPGYPVTSAKFKDCIGKMNELKPDFLIFTGDMINNPEIPAQQEMYEQCLAVLDPTIPVFVVPGNHDMRPYSDTTRQHYLDINKYERFSFIHKDCAFIGLDSNCIKEGADSLAQHQWDWLVEQLKKAADCRYRFLFIHCPVVRETIDEVEDYFNFPADLRQKYIDLCNEYKVDAFFSGHTHHGYHTKFGCTEFVNAGPVGPGLDGGYSGYNVVKVTRKGWSYEYVAL